LPSEHDRRGIGGLANRPRSQAPGDKGLLQLRASPFDTDHGSRSKTSVGVRWQDEARFIKTWLENPRGTGAVSPSGRALSRVIARQVDPSIPGPIIELGPGTGPVTEALIRRGIAPERLILVEYEPAFCKLLARRYPQCRIIQGDAYALRQTLRGVLTNPAAAIVSSLPLLNRRETQRLTLLDDAFTLMQPGAPFVQFTYGLVSPIPKHAASVDLPFVAHATAPVLLNLPPARVWTYRLLSERALADGRGPIDLMDRLRLGGEKLGEEWREHRERLRAEWLARSAEAMADWKARAQKLRSGIARQGARMKARDQRAGRADELADRRHRW
jgi:phosphatidylethanolamine/phosphatidyl-N-methylethanolamine N-methyltransferase